MLAVVFLPYTRSFHSSARHTRARLMANTITLRSSDGETFEVEEDVALCVRRARRARVRFFSISCIHSF